MASWNPAASVKVLKEGTDGSAHPVWVMPIFSGVTSCFDRLLNHFSGY